MESLVALRNCYLGSMEKWKNTSGYRFSELNLRKTLTMESILCLSGNRSLENVHQNKHVEIACQNPHKCPITTITNQRRRKMIGSRLLLRKLKKRETYHHQVRSRTGIHQMRSPIGILLTLLDSRWDVNGSIRRSGFNNQDRLREVGKQVHYQKEIHYLGE